jgi:hypothetical protein
MSQAGATPKITPVNSDRNRANPSTCQSSVSLRVAKPFEERRLASQSFVQTAMSSPKMPPVTAINMLSTSGGRTKREREAPRAARMACSWAREMARAS